MGHMVARKYGLEPQSGVARLPVSGASKPRLRRTGPLGETAARVLEFARRTFADRGYPATFAEIQIACGLRSTATVWEHMRALVDRGLIRQGDSRCAQYYPVDTPGPTDRALDLLRRWTMSHPRSKLAQSTLSLLAEVGHG